MEYLEENGSNIYTLLYLPHDADKISKPSFLSIMNNTTTNVIQIKVPISNKVNEFIDFHPVSCCYSSILNRQTTSAGPERCTVSF